MSPATLNASGQATYNRRLADPGAIHSMSNGAIPFPARRAMRLQGYDYRQAGAYFITVCAFRQACRFGEIRNGQAALNELGKTVQRCWLRIPELRANVELDAHVVMPNHLHGILVIRDDPASEVRSMHAEALPGLLPDSLGAIVGQFKRAVTVESRAFTRAPAQPIWKRNYYDHVIRSEESLNRIRRYIHENPARWHEDSLYNE